MRISPSASKAWIPLLAIVSFFESCSPKLAPPGHYQNTPIVADGIPDDWSLPLRFSNETYTIQYNVTSDNKNLYVCVLSRDEPTILRILKSGMTLYFDPKGEKNKEIGLHFPLRKQPDPASYRSRNGEPITGTNNNPWKEELLLQSDTYGTTGFYGIENGQFGLADTKGPIRLAMKFNRHDSLLFCEGVIPLKNILGTEPDARSPKKSFSVGILLNPPSDGGANHPRPVNGGGTRGMGMGFHSMGGGGGRRYGSGNSQPVKEEASWYQFRLATK
jgi:hypothetical protein